jgi:hypothetical protein
MSIQRILLATATLLSALAIAGTTTGAMAVASPQVHGTTVGTAHASQSHAVRPDAHTVCRPTTCQEF